MKTLELSRRTFLAAGGAVLATKPYRLLAEPVAPAAAGGGEEFITAFDDAWARHDAHALVMLHAVDAIVVNRFGSMLEGRGELEKSLGFLHGPGGPFHEIVFPRQKILTTRALGANMAAIHTKWSNPEMAMGDRLKNGGAQMHWVDMIATYLLVRNAEGWQLKQHDLHNVDPIQFPFPTKWNK